MRARWERLWMVADMGEKLTHPLVYPHPDTGESVCDFLKDIMKEN
jgi:hypothetical protein